MFSLLTQIQNYKEAALFLYPVSTFHSTSVFQTLKIRMNISTLLLSPLAQLNGLYRTSIDTGKALGAFLSPYRLFFNLYGMNGAYFFTQTTADAFIVCIKLLCIHRKAIE